MALIEKYNTVSNRKVWQQFLTTLGFLIDVDGIDGPATERATKAYQLGQGLRGDGLVGDQTIAVARLSGFKGFAEAVFVEVPVVPVSVQNKNLGRLRGCHPQLQEKVSTLVGVAAAEGFTLRVVQGFRSFEEQDRLYALGRTADGDRVTNARGGESWHNLGYAADLAFVVNGEVSWDDHLYPNIGRWAKSCGLEWGGTWKHKDLPHVQIPDLPNKPSASMLNVLKHEGLAQVWARFN